MATTRLLSVTRAFDLMAILAFHLLYSSRLFAAGAPQLSPISSSSVGQPDSAYKYTINLQLPCGPVRILTNLTTVFDRGERALSGLTNDERKSLIDWLHGTGVVSPWPVNRIARQHGVFHPATVMAAGLRYYFERILPPTTRHGPKPLLVFGASTEFSTEVTIVVESSLKDLTKNNSGVLELSGTNAIFDRATNTISIFIDPGLVEFFHPTDPQPGQLRVWVEAAWHTLQRTLLLGFYHELTHALQRESGKPQYLCPFLAEGEAEMVAGHMERFAIVTALMTEQFQLHQAKDLKKAASPKEFQTLITLMAEGTVLSPLEYVRYARARSSLKATKPGILERLLYTRATHFYLADNVGELYDFAWFAAYYIFTREPGESKRLVQIMRDAAVDREPAGRHDALAKLESEMRAWCAQKELQPLEEPERALRIAETMTQADVLQDQNKPMTAYLLYAALLQGNPDSPLLLSYIADLFHDTAGPDLYYLFYFRLQNQLPTMETNPQAGRFRLIERHIGALWKMGHKEEALRLARDHVIHYADIIAVMRISLDFRYDQERKRIGKMDEVASRKLDCEYALGEAIIRCQGTQHAEREGKELTGAAKELFDAHSRGAKDKCIRDIKRLMKMCGYSNLPAHAWFLLEWHLELGEIDGEALGLITK
jgi:hypothetical protein